MSTPLSPAIVLERLCKRYGDTRALDGVSATIEPGQFVAIVGRSGAGKTTLLRCLTRAVGVTDGRVRFGGVEVGTLRGRALRAHRARVGMIYQQFNLVRRLSVLDNVLVGRLAHVRGWRRWAALARWFDGGERSIALGALDHVGLLDRVWQRADTLSGGQQQRVAIARALAQEARVVLADEPVASLDLANGALVMQTLRETTTRAGLTVVATLHHVDYARRYADRVLGLRDGRLVFDGPAEALTDAAVVDILGERPESLPGALDGRPGLPELAVAAAT